MNKSDAKLLSTQDLDIIRMLQVDGRRSNSDLARSLGVSESTVRRRLDWLIEQGYMRVTANADPFMVGYSVFVLIQLQMDLTKVEETAEKLKALSPVSYVAITAGAYDILFTAAFASNEDLYEFLMHQLSSFPGVRTTAFSTILKVPKRSFVVPGAETCLVPEKAAVGRNKSEQ